MINLNFKIGNGWYSCPCHDISILNFHKFFFFLFSRRTCRKRLHTSILNIPYILYILNIYIQYNNFTLVSDMDSFQVFLFRIFKNFVLCGILFFSMWAIFYYAFLIQTCPWRTPCEILGEDTRILVSIY